MFDKSLIINAGSSSLKFSLHDANDGRELTKGNIERIKLDDGIFGIKINGKKVEFNRKFSNHEEAMDVLFEVLLKYGFINSYEEITSVGHRILHGGEFYDHSVLIDDEVINNVETLVPLGPLHLPGQLDCVKKVTTLNPNAKQVAVFDTAFHATIPVENYLYAIPYELYEKYKIRKYGFHGTSCKYITENMQAVLNKKDVNLIICHLGSGASITAVKNGLSYNTTMGLTPLDGLIMGTRSGSIDPSVVEHICRIDNCSVEEATNILNFESGLLGICGKSDSRDVVDLYNAGDLRAKAALEMFTNSIADYIWSYYGKLNSNVDGIVFTAGIGENSSIIRKMICEKLAAKQESFIEFDKMTNELIASYKSIHSGILSKENSKVQIYVVPTDEEGEILKETFEIVRNLDAMKRKIG